MRGNHIVQRLGRPALAEVYAEMGKVLTALGRTADALYQHSVALARERVRASGLIWEDVQEQLAESAAVIYQRVGRGGLVAFTEDPNYRAYNEASMLLFLNAVVLGPAHLPIPGVE